NFDTWGNIAMFKDLLASIEHIFSNESKGSVLYPVTNAWGLYGLDFFSGIIWIFFYKIGFSEIWSYWLYISVLLAFNSFGLFVFSKNFLSSNSNRWIAGLLFSLHHIVYLNIDNPNVLSYIFFFLSLHFILIYFKSNDKYHLILMALFASFQIYASPVVFIFLFFAVIVVLFFKYGLGIVFQLQQFILAAILVLLLISPYLYYYIFNDSGVNAFSFLELDKTNMYRYLSLKPEDLFRFFPHHLIYGKPSFLDYPFVTLKHIFPGFLLFGFFFIGIFIKQARLFFLLFIVFFLLGCGR